MGDAFKVVDKEKLKREAARKLYKMREGNYRVKVTILEANDLIPLDYGVVDKLLFEAKGGSMDPVVTVQVNNVMHKTKFQKRTLNPLFNQNFFIDLKDMKKD